MREAGTLAVTRTDIATQWDGRSRARGRRRATDAGGFDGKVRVRTSCPDCLQGMASSEDTSEVQAAYLVVEAGGQHLSAPTGWPISVARAKTHGGHRRVLVRG